ncbi:MAG: transcription termination/antitermination NusG family protein [Beijerinckiaceae bacterium]|nr:transcription termination/antitermination NusG family protein [Beijerinckiaceae bacterium]
MNSEISTTGQKRLLDLKLNERYDFVAVEKPLDLTAQQEGDWYVIQTKPGREMTAQANLVLRRVPFYLPVILKPARISHRAHQAGAPHPDVPVPLFPGLIFVSASVVDRCFGLISTTPGISSRPFWTCNEALALLRPDGMRMVRYIEAGERVLYERRKPLPKSAYEPAIGDAVEVLLTKFTGSVSGRVSEVDERGRITLLVEIMKRQVRVHATADQITPV